MSGGEGNEGGRGQIYTLREALNNFGFDYISFRVDPNLAIRNQKFSRFVRTLCVRQNLR